MSRKALVLVAVAIGLVVFELVGVPAATGEGWRRPLPGGAVVGSFTYERAAPYQRGRRRGIDLSARAGSPVLAACSGAVTYAGRVPRRDGAGVTIRCGRLAATELGLSKTLVRRGAHVAAGQPIGVLGAAPLRLGARIANDRHGYVDPLVLFGDGGGAPIAPPPVVVRDRRAKPRPARVRVAAPARSPEPASLPWLAVGGLAVMTSAAAGGATVRLRRRRKRRPVPAGSRGLTSPPAR